MCQNVKHNIDVTAINAEFHQIKIIKNLVIFVCKGFSKLNDLQRDAKINAENGDLEWKLSSGYGLNPFLQISLKYFS